MSDEPTAVDALGAIGHEARLSILRALVEVRRTTDDPFVRFTDLRDRAGIDDTGRFNYHLNRLLGTFVRKTEEGYRLSAFGHRILAPMMGGIFDPERDAEPIDAPGECPLCAGSLTIRPRDTTFQLVCEDDHVVNQGLLGYPGVLSDRDPDAVVTALGLLNTQGIELAVAGTCPTCHGSVSGAIDEHDETEAYLFRAPCDTCGNQFANTVGGCVSTHPAVVSFLADHGVDVRRTPPWAHPFQHAGAETVVSENPLQLRVDVDGDDERLSVIVDRSGSVVSSERTSI